MWLAGGEGSPILYAVPASAQPPEAQEGGVG